MTKIWCFWIFFLDLPNVRQVRLPTNVHLHLVYRSSRAAGFFGCSFSPEWHLRVETKNRALYLLLAAGWFYIKLLSSLFPSFFLMSYVSCRKNNQDLHSCYTLLIFQTEEKKSFNKTLRHAFLITFVDNFVSTHTFPYGLGCHRQKVWCHDLTRQQCCIYTMIE